MSEEIKVVDVDYLRCEYCGKDRAYKLTFSDGSKKVGCKGCKLDVFIEPR